MQETKPLDGEVPAEETIPNGLSVDPEEALLKQLFSLNPEQGFTRLFRIYQPVLCQHAFRFVHDQEMARDLVADVFTHFWQHENYRKVETSYRAYLFRAVRFKAVTQLRHQQVHQHFVKVQSDPQSDGTVERLLHEQDLLHYIEQTLDRLPPRCRQVFTMSRFDEKTYAEIANELSISVKAVEAHVSKALTAFRAALRDEWPLLAIILENFLF
ncbi:RNA polymerase sigma-70 factor [Telluribacter sp.]|uniref:RNA polymerase sigma-70 factor n=1 Tax=Telluribacter sp. TaxID=1978767 RepID=UPI002E1234C0|nr:RNA polymerase sigma-70 factor [Telluribacter sp.]